MFPVAHLCPKGYGSVRCAPADECAVVRILFLQIATDDRIGTTVPDSPRALHAGSGPVRFEDNNQENASKRQMFSPRFGLLDLRIIGPDISHINRVFITSILDQNKQIFLRKINRKWTMHQ
jgi:hypothetical protein